MSLDQELRSGGLMLLYPWRMTYLALLTPLMFDSASQIQIDIYISTVSFVPWDLGMRSYDGVTTKMCPDGSFTFSEIQITGIKRKMDR